MRLNNAAQSSFLGLSLALTLFVLVTSLLVIGAFNRGISWKDLWTVAYAVLFAQVFRRLQKGTGSANRDLAMFVIVSSALIATAG